MGLADTVHDFGELTITGHVAVTPWYTDVIFTLPAATPVTKPEEEIVAIPVLFDVHVGPDVTVCVVVAVPDPSAS